MRLRRFVSLVTLSLAMGAPAAVAQTGAEQLEKARLIERDERDPRRAVAVYEAVCKDPQTPPSLRSLAWLELGLCLERIGEAEAAKVALERASGGSGEAAARAKARLQGKSLHEDLRLALRVKRLIQDLRGDKDKAAAAHRDLVWIGTPAVPFVVEAIEQEKLDLDFVLAAMHVLSALGGDEVGAFLDRVAKSDDALLRRAVARGLPHRAGDRFPRETALQFLRDPDPKVRSEAFTRVNSWVPDEMLREFARKAEPELRVHALNVLRNRWPRTVGSMERDAAAMCEVVRVAVLDGEGDVRQQGLQFFGARQTASALLGTPAGRDLVLECIERKLPFGLAAVDTEIPAPEPQRVIEIAKSLGPLSSAPDRSPHGKLESLVTRWLPQWNAEAVPVCLELVELGYRGNDYWDPVKLHATVDHAPRIAELISGFSSPRRVAAWLAEKGRAESCLPPLRAEIERMLANADSVDARLLEALCGAVATVHNDAAAKTLVAVVERCPYLFDEVAQWLLQWPTGAEDPLVRLLPLGNRGQAASERSAIFARLVQKTQRGAAGAFAAAYDKGLTATRQSVGDHRGLQLVFAASRDGTYVHGYGPDEMAAILDACLATKNMAAWRDAWQMLDQVRYRIPDAAIAAICARLREAPESSVAERISRLILSHQIDAPAARALAKRLLESKEPQDRLFAVGNLNAERFDEAVPWLMPLLEDPSELVREHAIRQLRSAGDASVTPALRKRLGDSEPKVRSAALHAIVELDRDQAIEPVITHLDDPSYLVRLAAIKSCHTLLDTRAVPKLLARLRDEYDTLRKEARESLEAIRFYTEQHSHWDAWLKNLGATSTGEALRKQAAADQPKKIRVAAIAGLGTLADPKSLPFLIELMKDADEDIAAAAATAVARLVKEKPLGPAQK